MTIKSPVLSAIAISSMLFGLVFLTQGIILISDGYSDIEIVKIEGQSFSTDRLTSVMFHNDEPDAEFSTVKVNFDTFVIFQGDQIGITATALNVKSDVKGMAVLFVDPSFNMNNTNTELGKEIEWLVAHNRAVELVPNSDPPYNTRKYVDFPIANEVIVHVAILKDNAIDRALSVNPITIVQERTEKTPIETYKLILKQYEEQQKANREQDRTNTIFLGFSWIGVALIMILGGVDVLLRVRFDSRNDSEYKIYR